MDQDYLHLAPSISSGGELNQTGCGFTSVELHTPKSKMPDEVLEMSSFGKVMVENSASDYQQEVVEI